MPIPSPRKHAMRHVIQAVTNTPWTIEESALDSILELMDLRSNGFEFTATEVAQRIGRSYDDDPAEPRMVNGVAVLPLYGILAPRMNLMLEISGGTSTQVFGGWFQDAIKNPDVHAIVFDVDSPGGSAYGNEELANLIRAHRGQKPIVSVANNTMASAAYYVGSSADQIVATPSASLGSIGTYAIHRENSRANAANGVTYSVIKAGENKAIGNNVEPLTPHARGVMQEMIDDLNAMFLAAVAANRKVPVEKVIANFGQGKSMLASRAVAAGLADRIATLNEVIAELGKKSTAVSLSQTTAGQTADPAPVAPEPPAPTPPHQSLPPTSLETPDVDPKIKAALIKHGIIQADASDDVAQTALTGFFKGLKQSVPKSADATVKAIDGHFQEDEEEEEESQEVETPPARAKSPKGIDAKTLRAQERARIEDLTARAELLGIDKETLQVAIDGEMSVEKALVQWTAKGADVNVPARRVESGKQAVDKFAQGAVEALGRRAGIDTDKQLSDSARDLEHRTLLQIAEASLQMAGVRAVGSPDDIAIMALRGDGGEIRVRASSGTGYHRPSDFPNLMSNLAGKMLDKALTYSPATYKQWCAPLAAVPDFKPKTMIATGEFGEFPLVQSGDDFEEGSTPAEEASWIAVDSYGDEWSFTPRMLLDDDLGALDEAMTDKQIAHELTLNRLAVELLTGNAVAGDGKALFHADHNNDLTAGGVPSETELAAMRLKLRKQTGISNKRKLNLTLKLLLVPEDIETTTEKLLANTLQVGPVDTANAQIFRGRVSWVVEPMLGEHSDKKYYGFADKNLARAIVYCHQRGFESMVTRNYYHPKNNSRVFQFEGRFAAAIRQWRGVVRNKGEA